jgi:CheY-like chemotaxis protein
MIDPETFAERRVLVLDDNKNFQRVMRTILRAVGFRRVDVLSEAPEVLPMLVHQHMDLAFIDMVLGGSRTDPDGLGLIEDIRHAPDIINRAMPIVLVTGHASRSVVTRAMTCGADHVLAKPLSPSTVLKAVTALLAAGPRYVRGEAGYFGPDLDAARMRIEGRINKLDNRAARPDPAPAPTAAQPRAPSVPGLNVALRDKLH